MEIEAILQALNTPLVPCFVIVLKCFKEISCCICPLTFCHVHLPTTFTNYSHDPWMWYG